VEIQRFGIKRRLPREIQQPLDDLPNPVRRLGDGFQVFADILGEVLSPEQQMRKGQDAGQRVIDSWATPPRAFRCWPASPIAEVGSRFRPSGAGTVPHGFKHFLKGLLEDADFTFRRLGRSIPGLRLPADTCLLASINWYTGRMIRDAKNRPRPTESPIPKMVRAMKIVKAFRRISPYFSSRTPT